ncbi:hypothetical protein LBMAG48_00760 [Phycisphaerae bacterium]|nr:hypothetical protein LBMAG48_00760 [Phycisphaerae bacterium]
MTDDGDAFALEKPGEEKERGEDEAQRDEGGRAHFLGGDAHEGVRAAPDGTEGEELEEIDRSQGGEYVRAGDAMFARGTESV